jgi:hypothetical protein
MIYCKLLKNANNLHGFAWLKNSEFGNLVLFALLNVKIVGKRPFSQAFLPIKKHKNGMIQIFVISDIFQSYQFFRYRTDYETSVLSSLPESTIEEEANQEMSWNTASYLTSHPILVVKMLSRYSLLLSSVYQDISQNFEDELMERIEGIRGSSYFWPNEKDLEDSTRALFRIQDVYGIHPNEVRYITFTFCHILYLNHTVYLISARLKPSYCLIHLQQLCIEMPHG